MPTIGKIKKQPGLSIHVKNVLPPGGDQDCSTFILCLPASRPVTTEIGSSPDQD